MRRFLFRANVDFDADANCICAARLIFRLFLSALCVCARALRSFLLRARECTARRWRCAIFFPERLPKKVTQSRLFFSFKNTLEELRVCLSVCVCVCVCYIRVCLSELDSLFVLLRAFFYSSSSSSYESSGQLWSRRYANTSSRLFCSASIQ